MKLVKSITTTAVLSLFALGNAWAEDEARSFAPIFGDVHATPGQEVAMPFFKLKDTNGDTYPDSINVSFKVYTAGTNDFLRQTQVLTIPTPAIPAGCTAADAANNFDFSFFPTRRGAQLGSLANLEAASKRITIASNMTVECNSTPGGPNYTWAENEKGIVYSADLSGTEAAGLPGPAWFKQMPGRIVEGLNGVDVDGDLVNDHLVITTGGPTPTGGWTLGVIYAAGKTGAIDTTITTSDGSIYTLPTSYKFYTVVE